MALLKTNMVCLNDGGYGSSVQNKKGVSNSDIQAQLDAKAQEKSECQTSIESFESQYNNLSSQQEQVETELSSAKETVSLSETAVLAAEQDVLTAKSAVVSAQSTVNSAKNQVSSANSAVQSANNALRAAYAVPVKIIKNDDGTVTYDTAARDAALKSAKSQLAAAQSKLKQAEAKLSNAEEKLTKANSDLKAAESKLKSAQNDLKQAQQAVTTLEAKASQFASQLETLDTKISDLEAKMAIVEQQYDALLQQAQQAQQTQQEEQKQNESPENKEEETQTVEGYMLDAIEAELSKQKNEVQTEADSKTGLGCAWNAVKGWFGGGTKGELDSISEMQDTLNSLKDGADIADITELYAKVFSEQPDIEAIKESIKVQETLKDGSITLDNGQSVDRKAIAEELTYQIELMSNDFNDSVESQGIFSKGISKVNNIVGLGTTEKMTQAQMNECQNLVEQLGNAKTEEEFASVYKALTGEDLTKESLNELFEGSSKVSNTKAAEAAMDYEETQESALNAVSTTVAGVVTATMGPLAGMAVAAAVNVGIKSIDAATQTNDKTVAENLVDYAKEDLLKDALVGGATGLSGGLANKAGSAVSNAVLKSNVGNIITNKVGESLIETTASRITGEIVEGALDGAVGNSLEYVIDCALDEEKDFSLSELGQTAAIGMGFGALTSVAMGEATNKILGSKKLSVEAGDEIKIDDGYLTNTSTGKSVSVGKQKVISLNKEVIDIDNTTGTISLDPKNSSIFAKDSVTIHTNLNAIQNASVGEMCQLPNQKNVGIKLKDGSIEELNISADTYKRLFPDGNDVKVKQGQIGDCYLVSAAYTMLSDPETSPSVLRCFTESPDGTVSFSFPDGKYSVDWELGAKVTDFVEKSKISTGSEGVQMIEHAYGLELVGKEMSSLQDQLSGATNDLDALLTQKTKLPFSSLLDVDTNGLDYDTAKKMIDDVEFNGLKIGDFNQSAKEQFFYSKYIINSGDGVSFNTASINEQHQKILNSLNEKITKQEKMISDISNKITEITTDATYEAKLRDDGGCCNDVFGMFQLKDAGYKKLDSGIDMLKDTSSVEGYIFAGGTYGDSDRYYLNKELNVVGKHAYTIKPQKIDNEKFIFEITNPHNTSKHVFLTEEQVREYFRGVYYAKKS